MLFQTYKSFVHLRNTIWDDLDKSQEACDCPIDCQVTLTIKAQKRINDIVKIVHLPSVVQSECYEATRILFGQKRKQK